MAGNAETDRVLSTLTQLRGASAWQAAAIVATLLAGTFAAVFARGATSAPPGHLAALLAAQRANVVAAHVAPSVRDELTTSRLSAAWTAAVEGVGPLRTVSRHYVVNEGAHVQDELEVLQFAGGTGVLTARRTPAGITGLVLLVSALHDRASAAAASAYAQQLVAGQVQPVRARFDAEMTTALPADVLSAETAAITAGLQPPARVAGQIVVRRAGLTVVETYLLFRNGLRRVEMSLEPNGSIAGLYIRPL